MRVAANCLWIETALALLLAPLMLASSMVTTLHGADQPATGAASSKAESSAEAKTPAAENPGYMEYAVPAASRGGSGTGQLWADVPEGFHVLQSQLPDWPVPTNLEAWTKTDREQVRATLLRLLGPMPERPDPKQVKVISREQLDGYTLERFEFHNGIDSRVPGVLLIPDGLTAPAPTIIAMHGHSSSKESCCVDPTASHFVGAELARRGYVVAAIDAYFNGERVGQGPRGNKENKVNQEHALVKLNHWLGRTLWGLMLRDEQCLLDYLETRPEVDAQRIGAEGMSMGCVRASWLSAIDERIHSHVGICCFTRYSDIIAHGRLNSHAMYFYVPGMLANFDVEAMYALSAPRPMLLLSGEQDPLAPMSGVLVLEDKLQKVYRLHGKPENFHSVVYKGTGHEYLPEMKQRMMDWFDKHMK